MLGTVVDDTNCTHVPTDMESMHRLDDEHLPLPVRTMTSQMCNSATNHLFTYQLEQEVPVHLTPPNALSPDACHPYLKVSSRPTYQLTTHRS